MNFTDFFIHRVVFTSLMVLFIFLAGIVVFPLIPVSALPKLDFPVVRVSASLPGATPETMARVVALPLERNFSTIAGIQSIISSSTLGSTVINLQFDLERNIDAAAQDVNSAIAAAQKTLPPDLPTPPTYKKVDPSEQPVLYLAIKSDLLPLNKVNDYAQAIADRISILPGVAQVELLGSQLFAVRIYVDAGLAAIRNLSLSDIKNTINRANINSPTGQLDGAFKTQIIKSESELYNALEYDDIILSNKKSNPLRIKDIGYSANSIQNDRTAAWFNGVRCILLAVSRQPGSNTIEVVDSALKILPTITEQLPPSLSIEVISDRSQSIREAVRDVEFSFLLSMILVIIVIYFFLQSAKATLIPAITLPLSIMITLVFIYYNGYSLNNLTLLALTLAVGFIVDDAIVVMENIASYIEHRHNPLKAALKGSSEITFTIFSMTLSLVVVFLPIIFLQGILGRLFHEFGMTISIVILMSGFVSLTVTPVMCRYLLNIHPSKCKKISFTNWFQIFFDKLKNYYEKSLLWVMKHQKATLYSLGIIFLLNLGLLSIIPKGFFPNEDTGFVYGVTEANTDVSFEEMVKIHQKVMNILRHNPNVAAFNASVGASTTTQALNNGRFFIRLKPFKERKVSIEEFMSSLRASFADLPEIKVYMQSIQNLRIGGSLGKSQYVYTIQGSNTNELYSTAALLQEELSKIQGVTDVGSDAAVNSSQIVVSIDRDRAYTLGVPIEEINNTLNLVLVIKESL
jgi:HAE1 family hydrophobic/amphiphilic exporter-1